MAAVKCGADDYLGSGLICPTAPPEFRAALTKSVVTLEMFVTLGTNGVVHPGLPYQPGISLNVCGLRAMGNFTRLWLLRGFHMPATQSDET